MILDIGGREINKQRSLLGYILMKDEADYFQRISLSFEFVRIFGTLFRYIDASFERSQLHVSIGSFTNF